MPTLDIPNSRIFKTAQTFARSARLLYREQGLEIPFVVNGAFSVELFLKALGAEEVHGTPMQFVHTIQGEQVRGESFSITEQTTSRDHAPSAIFQSLSKSVREEIEAGWLSAGHKDSFVSILQAMGDPFVKWRYGFQGDSRPVNATQLLDAIGFLEEYVRNFKNS